MELAGYDESGNTTQMVQILSQKDGRMYDSNGNTINKKDVDALNRSNNVVIVKNYNENLNTLKDEQRAKN